MIEIHLTDKEIQDLNEAIDDPSHSEKNQIKLLVIRKRHEGVKTGFISKCLNLHDNAVTNYLNEFQARKLFSTLEDRYDKPTSALDPFLSCIKCSFRAYPVPAKFDHQLQFDFYTREMLPWLEEARLGERKVRFMDAAHFVLGAFLGLIWCFQRIFLKNSPGRQR